MQTLRETSVKDQHKFVKVNLAASFNTKDQIIIAGETVHDDIGDLTLFKNSASIRFGSKTVIWFNETEKLAFVGSVRHFDNWVIDEQNKMIYYTSKHKMRLPTNTIFSGYVFNEMLTLDDYAGRKLSCIVYFDDGIKIIRHSQTSGWSNKDGKIVYNDVAYDKEADKITTRSDNLAIIVQYDPVLETDLHSVLEYRNNRMFCIEGSTITEIMRIDAVNNYRNVELLLKNTKFNEFVLEQNEKILFAIKYGNAKYEDIVLSLYEEYCTKPM